MEDAVFAPWIKRQCCSQGRIFLVINFDCSSKPENLI